MISNGADNSDRNYDLVSRSSKKMNSNGADKSDRNYEPVSRS